MKLGKYEIFPTNYPFLQNIFKILTDHHRGILDDSIHADEIWMLQLQQMTSLCLHFFQHHWRQIAHYLHCHIQSKGSFNWKVFNKLPFAIRTRPNSPPYDRECALSNYVHQMNLKNRITFISTMYSLSFFKDHYLKQDNILCSQIMNEWIGMPSNEWLVGFFLVRNQSQIG